MMHLLSIVVLLLKITGTKSCRGAAAVRLMGVCQLWCAGCSLQLQAVATKHPACDGLQHTTLQLWNWPAPNAPRCVRPARAGVSLRTQELYALVFFTRYLDLFTNFVSV